MSPNSESWLDKAIREAEERGEWDTSAGAGKPLPGAGAPYEEDWWLKSFLRREHEVADGLLPMSLRLRREVERLPDTVRALKSEQQVRQSVQRLNDRIAEWLRMPTPPHVTLEPIDPDDVVAGWQTAQRGDAPPSPPAKPRRRRWGRSGGR